MDLFVRSISFAANETDVTVELARILHKPPFPLEPPTNFQFELIQDRRTKRHKGCGTLTLADTAAGQTLMRLFASGGISVKGRPILLSPSKHQLQRGVVERLRSTSWQDPQVLMEERKRRASASEPIKLAEFCYGRFRRGGTTVFFAERDLGGSGRIVCDLSLRQLRLEVERKDRGSSGQGSLFDMGILTGLIGDLMGSQKSAVYAPTQIKAMFAPHSPYCVFLETRSQPIFQETRSQSIFQESRDRSDRQWSLHPDREMPSACNVLRVTFNSDEDRSNFLGRCRQLHLTNPSRSDILQEDHSDYSGSTMTSLHDCLQSLEFGLAFQAEKSVADAILSPAEVLSLRKELLQLHADYDTQSAAVFKYFVETVRESYHDVPRRRRRRRRGNRNQAIPAEQLTLVQQLNTAATSFFADRKKPRLYSPVSPAHFQSYHLTITPSDHILEGPLPDQSNNVLRRFGHHDHFLRVSFYDEGRTQIRRDANTDISKLLRSRFRKPLIDGLKLAGRSYEFLGYSMSGLRDHSVWFVSPFTYEERRVGAEDIRLMLGDFSALAYEPARLAARWSQAFSATDPTMALDPSEIDRSLKDRISSSGSMFTDGVGTISSALAKSAWAIIRSQKGQVSAPSSVPSAFQFRLGGAKGMVVVDNRLVGRVICIRKSQAKFDAPDNRAFDVQSTSSRPRLMFLNRPMIVVLEYLGVPARSLVDLQDRAVREVEAARESLLEASKLFGFHGLGPSFRLPSLFSNLKTQLHLDLNSGRGFDALYHHLITEAIRCACTHALREIKYRAHVRVPGSFTLLGVADEWSCLREGEIYATIRDERTGLRKPIEGKVLITRSPQVHPGDVQFVTAVRRPELSHLYNCVVFSCEGERSLPSCLAGGDLDGDDYNLILDPALHPTHTVAAGEYKGLPNKRTDSPCTIVDIADFFINYIENDLLGYIAILHLRFADLKDPGCRECIDLAEKASHAVDFPKTGAPVTFASLPMPPSREKPDFLAGEGSGEGLGPGFYPSDKVLGTLFRRVPLDARITRAIPPFPSDGRKIEECLREIDVPALGLPSLSEPSEELMQEMGHTLEMYCDDLLAIAQTHTLSKHHEARLSEEELVSGTIMSKWASHRKRREAVDAMNLQTQQLTRAIRRDFARSDTHDAAEEDDWDSEDEDDLDEEYRRRKAETFKRAWAAWRVAEEALEPEGEGEYAFGPMSFGLIALGTMLDVIKQMSEFYMAD